jgi:hypothetical protein
MIRMAIKLVVIFILCSCQPNGNNKNHSQQDTTNIVTMKQTDTIDISKWKSDSLGCKHIRTPELFDKLFVGNKMEHKNANEFIYFFGKPNNQEKFKDRLILIYYYNSICSNDKLNINSDKSSIRISFNLENKYLEKDTRVE